LINFLFSTNYFLFVDIFVGSLIGATVSYTVYHQYFPSVFDCEIDDSYSRYVASRSSLSGNNNHRSNISVTDGSRSRQHISSDSNYRSGFGGLTRIA